MLFSRLVSARSKIDSRFLVVVILVILSLLTSEVSASCRRRLSVQTISVNDCLPKRLLTYSCSGECSTHAQISSTYPFDITRTCYQCKETVLRDRRVKVKCPSKDAASRFMDVYMTVKVPGGCMCQVCETVDDVELISEDNTAR